MKANELRIGNVFIEKYSNKVIKVLELLRSGNIVFDFECLTTWQAVPIKLNEGWLIKFGLEEGTVGYYHIGEFIISVEGQVYFGETETWIAEIHFAHQLQNLYYALTGEELSLSGI
jgi:hypothetical protein